MSTILKTQKHGISAPLLGCSVLIADRNPSAQKPLKDELNSLGVRNIDVASDVPDLMRSSARGYDFIFVDSLLSDKRSTSSILEELAKIKRPKKEVVFVISNDRSSSFLQSLIEYEPDEYIIKPYSTEDLSRKITRAAQKRKALSIVEGLIASRKFDEAIETSDRMAEEFPQYKREFFKKKVESLVAADALPKAEALIRKQITEKSHPWMEVLLAQILIGSDEFSEAESWLRKSTSTIPEYTKSADALSILLYSTDKVEEAYFTLDSLGMQAHSSVARLRFMSGLAGLLGKGQEEKSLLQKAIDRAGHGALACESDYHRMASIFVDESRPEDAINCVSAIKLFAEAADLEHAAPVVRVKAALKEGAEGKAREALFGLLRKIDSRGWALRPGSAYAIAEVCLPLGKEDAAMKLLNATDCSSADFWLVEKMESLKEKLALAIKEKAEASRLNDESESITSKPVMHARGSRVDGDLAVRAKGILSEPAE